MTLSLWYLYLVTVIASSDPQAAIVSGPFNDEAGCQAYVRTIPQAAPGSHYECRTHVKAK